MPSFRCRSTLTENLESMKSSRPYARGGSRASGFTLIELLVVITIVTLLLTFLLPALGSARDASYVGKCKANLRSLDQGWHAYTVDHSQHIIPGSSRLANSASNIAWYDNPNSASGNVVAGLNHEGLMGAYVPPPVAKENTAYGCPGDYFYPTTRARRITYDYSYNIQSFAVADPPYYAGDKPYYWNGPGSSALSSTANGIGFNRLFLIRTEPSKVGLFSDGFYTAATAGGPYSPTAANQTCGLTTYKATNSDPTLVPMGNFADPLGSTTVYSGTTIYYARFHPNKTTNIAFLDGHVAPMTWEDVIDQYPEKSGDSFPFSFNY